MKNIYSILSLFLILISTSVMGQTKIYAPNLRAPENMEESQMPDALLDWDAVTGITTDITYEAQLANNSDFTDAVTFPRTDVTAQAMSDLLFGSTYYWRVRAYDSEEVSGWSEAWSFSVVWAVSMLKPNDADDEIYSNPVITWTPLTGITSYQMQIDTSYSWKVDASGVTSTINSTYIVEVDNSWAFGADGIMLHNDGTGWASMESGTTENLNDVYFIDASVGYAVGDGGTVLYFDGTTWEVVDAGVTDDLFGVSFADADNGVVVGAGGVIVTYNTGAWTTETTGDDNDLYDVAMLDASNIWACGLGKIVVNYNGTDWAANVVGTKDHYAIAMISENNGWIVGKSGKVNGWDGNSWSEAAPGGSKDLNAISFSGGNGVAAGASGTMLVYNGIWSKATSVVGTDLEGVAINGGAGYAVGEDGVIIKQTNGGFDSPMLVTYDISSDSSSWPLSELLFGQTYFYRLSAIHGADTSMWSGVKSFTTYAAPELTSPSNGSIEDLLVDFDWVEYKGVTNYIFEIDVNENFTNPGYFDIEDNFLGLIGFGYGEQYFWRVAAEHGEDFSDWSETRNFFTVNTITLESPANEAVEVPACPAYSWVEVLGATEYELWVDTDATFSNPLITTTDKPSYQCQSQLTKNTLYYWKVRGVAGSDFSNWSDVWSFTIEGAIGIDDKIDIDAVNIYPNPSTGEFVLDITSFVDDTYEVKVVDISGKLVYTSTINCQVGNNSISINVENINSGVYSLMISNDSQAVTRRLLIK